MKTLSERIKQIIIDLEHPVGSLYANFEYVDPATIYGGTWEQIKDVFLLACGDTYSAGETGGSTSHLHNYKLGYYPYYCGLATRNDTEAILTYDYSSAGWNVGQEDNTLPKSENVNSGVNEGASTATPAKYSIEGTTSSALNMPPYMALYVWKRTA